MMQTPRMGEVRLGQVGHKKMWKRDARESLKERGTSISYFKRSFKASIVARVEKTQGMVRLPVPQESETATAKFLLGKAVTSKHMWTLGSMVDH